MAGVLDEAVDLVARGVPGPAGLLALTSLPMRFLEAHLANRLMQLGEGARGSFDHIVAISWLVTFALLPALWGRAVFVRACALELSGSARGVARMPLRQRLRLRPAAFASYAYTALLYETLYFSLGWTLAVLPVLALLTGLAAATSHLDEPPGLLASPLRALRHARPLSTLAGLTAVLAVALLVALLNLATLFWLLMILADGTMGLDLSWWSGALSWDNRQYVLLLVAGAVTLVEPFWLAALVSTVRSARARQSGEDLAAWFADLRRGEEAA